MEFIKCVEDRLEELGLRPSTAEQRFDLPPDTIRNLLRSAGNKNRSSSGPTLSKVQQICDALGLELYFGPPRSQANAEGPDLGRFAMVARYDANAAAGNGHINFDAPPIDHLAFSRDWMVQNGIRPSECVLINARGESMAPGIQDRDLVMVDRRRTELKTGGIFVYNDTSEGTRIKRIEIVPNTAIILRSDNPDQKLFPPEYHTGEAMNAISRNVVGQVVWSGHTWR